MKIQILTNGTTFKVMYRTFWGWRQTYTRESSFMHGIWHCMETYPTEAKARKYIKERWGTEAEIASNKWREI